MSKDSRTPPPPGGQFLVYQTEDGRLKNQPFEGFLLRRGYGGRVGDPPSPRPRRTGLGDWGGHGAAFAALRRAKPSLAPGGHAGGTLTLPLARGEGKREASRRLWLASSGVGVHPIWRHLNDRH